jgi:ATP-dependent DNA helicase RecG
MARFKKGETNVLVGTTVIEVGVDVPNASVMVIENAERFGLAQLHQLRGARVGRGADQSYCILMTGDKLGNDSRTRINTMVRTNDGFEISEVDLRLRGPGRPDGHAAERPARTALGRPGEGCGGVATGRTSMAQRILDEDPSLQEPRHAPMAAALQEQMHGKAVWGRIG